MALQFFSISCLTALEQQESRSDKATMREKYIRLLRVEIQPLARDFVGLDRPRDDMRAEHLPFPRPHAETARLSLAKFFLLPGSINVILRTDRQSETVTGSVGPFIHNKDTGYGIFCRCSA
ncbi:hypothetical protein K461DRAFT_136410 [Myriangium duriaei CBS 260.36]|uniref:Uncharacterized protein n=1 Tax=Myriangium duriaei CBS 260.36 TaxID=1168546 RepID=A0A9P4J693_9PEZI|nr:hypothetical protein K461DRAFT_136410 [Myriangium duriaei CBS 260.36]